MNGDVVIRAEGLGKQYVIGHLAQREPYLALRDVIARGALNLGRSAVDLVCRRPVLAGGETEEFWALKNVSFEVRRGEVLGIVGRNGAGKSTLLKILSRITEPSEGRVTINGRVASLLEVGTGFHPELTGRENVYLNGAILGMSHREIRSKFDEIVDFAEVEQFLDTPVKRFSSGMYVRLAFAVAAHLEPEILIIDEVLAVGDAEFQQKCLGKMGQVASGGRTVLFVSHNIATVRALCDSAIYLHHGAVMEAGALLPVLEAYGQAGPTGTQFRRSSPPSSVVSVVAADASYDAGGTAGSAYIRLDLKIFAHRAMYASVDVHLKDSLGSAVAFASLGQLNPGEKVHFGVGSNELSVLISANGLAHGSYRLGIALANPNVAYYDRIDDCLKVQVDPIGRGGETRSLKQEWGLGSLVLPIELGPQPR